MSKHSIA